MNDFQQLWVLLRQHGSSAKRETECAAKWATYPPEMQQRIYNAIRSKLEQGKFVHYDPVRALEENGVSVNPDENDLEGVDAITAVTSIDGLTRDNCYVLSGQQSVGFYLINSDNLKAHKAYVKYVSTPGQNNAPKKMRFVFNTTTGVESAQPSVISGQKLIENGQLIIIKNGVRYNAQGQIVK